MVTGLKAPTGVSTVSEINILTHWPRRLVDKKKNPLAKHIINWPN